MKRFVSIAISVALLVILYSKIDLEALVDVFQNCDVLWMTISLGMVIPITAMTAWRLQQLMPPDTHLGFVESNRLILGSSVLNMVLPSKMGEIAKAYFLSNRGFLKGSLAISLVIFERACDMLSLLFWCVLGLVFYPEKNLLFLGITTAIVSLFVLLLLLISSQKFTVLFLKFFSAISPQAVSKKLKSFATAWQEVHHYFWNNPKQFYTVTATSILLWFLHLLQIWFFIIALKDWAPFIISLAFSPLAILAGLLPLTFAGVGTRDAALLYLYEPYCSQSVLIALGILCTSRYFLPALIGLPFLTEMMIAVRKVKENSI